MRNLVQGGWDYCSPAAELGVHKSDHVELTRHGVKCRDVCSLKGYSYFWCTQYGGEFGRFEWDYCSPDNLTTINQVHNQTGKLQHRISCSGKMYWKLH